MRFKAELAAEQLQLLYSLIGPISRLSSKAIVYLDCEYIRISCRDSDGIICFAELKAQHGIFLSHRIESVANNSIVFEIDLIQWRGAMQSIVGERHDSAQEGPLETSSDAMMKLGKRDGISCLCLYGMCAGTVEVNHAIPIRLMRAGDMK